MQTCRLQMSFVNIQIKDILQLSNVALLEMDFMLLQFSDS